METYTVKVYENGTRHWYQNDKLHRLDGPAVESSIGTNEWYQNGLRHREDGPAVEYTDGHCFWYQNGKLHRLDGPAVDHTNDDQTWCHSWWIEGKQFTEKEFLKKIKKTTCENLTVIIDGIKYKLVKE
jgi:hypothetical protein